MKIKELLLNILLSPLMLIGIILWPFIIIKDSINGRTYD